MVRMPRPQAPVYGDPVEAHRNRYEQESMARAEAVDRAGMSPNLNMFSQAERTRQGNSLARSQAAYMPEWDRWFQAAGIGGNTSFGRGGDTGGFSSLTGLQNAIQPAQTTASTDELIDASQENRRQGAQTRHRYGGRIGPNETGRRIY